MRTTEANAAASPRRGRFWVAGAEEQQVAGELTLGSGDPTLELSAMLTPAWTEGSPNSETGATVISRSPVSDNESLTVHGFVDGTAVTLVDAFTTGRRYSFTNPDSGEHRLEALYAITGAHVHGKDALYTAVRIRTSHLDEWAHLPGFEYSLTEAMTPKSIVYEKVDVPPVQLRNGGSLSLEQVVTMSSPTARGGALNRTVWLRAVDLPAAQWRALDRDVVTPLSTLLTLATDTDCPVVAVELMPQEETNWCAVHSRGTRPPAGRPFNTHDVLLPRTVLGLPELATWLERVEVLGSLPSVVADTAVGPSQALETQVLILTTVAEGLARRLWPDWVRIAADEAEQTRQLVRTALDGQGNQVVAAVEGALAQLHEPSYPKRLLKLAQRVDAVVPAAVGHRNNEGVPNRWKKAVVDARNELAHQMDRGWLDDARVDRYLTVITSLRWLLTAVLLREAGVAPDKLAERFNQHERYHLFIEQARAWLPAVYEPRREQRPGETSDELIDN